MIRKPKTSHHSSVRNNRLDCFTVYEVGRVRHGGRTWAVGVSFLKGRGLRGVALTPKGRRPGVGAIVVGDHLPAGGPMAREAAIHEALHVAFPKAREAQVVAAAKLVAKVLATLERATVRPSPRTGMLDL